VPGCGSEEEEMSPCKSGRNLLFEMFFLEMKNLEDRTFVEIESGPESGDGGLEVLFGPTTSAAHMFEMSVSPLLSPIKWSL
jgi:hypothetical protein